MATSPECSPTANFCHLLQQSRQLTAKISGNNSTPSIFRGLEQIESATAKLAAKVGIAGQPSHEAFRHAALAKIKLSHIGADKATASHSSDIASYLQAEYEKRILASMDRIQKETSDKINQMINDHLASNWEKRKQQLLEEGLDKIDWTLSNRSAQAKPACGTVSLSSPRSSQYLAVVKALNNSRVRSDRVAIAACFANELRPDAEADSGVNGLITSFWDCLSSISREDGKTSTFLDSSVGNLYRASSGSKDRAKWDKILISGSRKYLEDAFAQFVQSIITLYPRDALLGGKPSVADRIRAFVNVRVKQLGPLEVGKLELVDGLPIWSCIYYMFRCGYLREAYQFAAQHEIHLVKSEPAFVSYLKAFIETEDNCLTGAIKAQIQSDYSQRIIIGNQDPFKMALLKILGRCDLGKKSMPHVIQTTEDYVWLQLWLVSEAAHSSSSVSAPPSLQSSSTYTLGNLQTLIVDLGAKYFNPKGRSPLQYFETLLCVGLFEDAVAYLFENGYYLDAVHFAIALAYHGTLNVFNNPIAASSETISSAKDENGRAVKTLNFYKLISSVAKPQSAVDPINAIHYYLLLPLVAPFASNRYTTLCQESIRDVILAAGDYATLLGDVTPDGIFRSGIVAKFAPLLNVADERLFIESITKAAAVKCEKEDKYRDAVHLYNLAGDYDHVLYILSKKMCQAFAQAYVAEAFTGLHSMAQSIYQFYLQHPTASAKVDRCSLETFRIHLKLMEFKRFAAQASWSLALQNLEQLSVLPLDCDVAAITQYVDKFKSLDDSIAVNLSELLLLAMTCIYQSFLNALNSASTDLGRQQLVSQLRRQSRSLMVFVGMIQYRISPEICSKLTRMDVFMN